MSFGRINSVFLSFPGFYELLDDACTNRGYRTKTSDIKEFILYCNRKPIAWGAGWVIAAAAMPNQKPVQLSLFYFLALRL